MNLNDFFFFLRNRSIVIHLFFNAYQISEVVLTVVMGILDVMYRSMSKMRVVALGRSTVERSNDLT